MRPNDQNGRLPLPERPFRVLILAGSDRRQYNCPGVDSKSRALMVRMPGRKDVEIQRRLRRCGRSVKLHDARPAPRARPASRLAGGTR